MGGNVLELFKDYERYGTHMPVSYITIGDACIFKLFIIKSGT